MTLDANHLKWQALFSLKYKNNRMSEKQYTLKGENFLSLRAKHFLIE